MEDQILIDFQDRKIRFTLERQEHIIQFHPEMVAQLTRIPEVLQNPEKVVQSQSDDEVELYYHFYQDTPVGEKYLCVLVKVLQKDAFIITAYFTDAIKKRNMEQEVKVWFDPEGDYLEVLFEQKAGFFRETENDSVMEKVDQDGKVIGFSIMKVSYLKQTPPLSIHLKREVA